MKRGAEEGKLESEAALEGDGAKVEMGGCCVEDAKGFGSDDMVRGAEGTQAACARCQASVECSWVQARCQ